jgi:hypothetical protein
MAERPDQIEKHIRDTRSELGNNLHELEYKVKQATDWKTYFERNPMTIMSLAFGGGVLLASMLGSKNAVAPSTEHTQHPKNFADPIRRSPMSDGWDTLKSALIGFTALKVRNVLDEAIPGFGDQLEKAEREVSNRTLSRPRGYDREMESSAHRM